MSTTLEYLLHKQANRLLGSLIIIIGLGVNCGELSTATFAETPERTIPEINWTTTIGKFQFDAEKFVGQRLTVKCPPASAKQELGGLFGTDSYPSESSICIAALHAGKITLEEGGIVTIQLNPGEANYEGSVRNGVVSANLPETKRSISFVEASATADKEIDQTRNRQLPVIKWDTKFTATGLAYRKLVGQRFTFRCPPAPPNFRPRIVYGTDDYDFSSIICQAAVHAGKLTKEGGLVTVQINEGIGKLVGSIRNGIETKSKNGSDRTIVFVDN